jgi:hypothetical protein
VIKADCQFADLTLQMLSPNGSGIHGVDVFVIRILDCWMGVNDFLAENAVLLM